MNLLFLLLLLLPLEGSPFFGQEVTPRQKEKEIFLVTQSIIEEEEDFFGRIISSSFFKRGGRRNNGASVFHAQMPPGSFLSEQLVSVILRKKEHQFAFMKKNVFLNSWLTDLLSSKEPLRSIFFS